MRTVSGPFSTAEEEQNREATVTVTLSNNREQLNWTYFGDIAGASNWQGQQAHVTYSNTLLRSWATATSGTVSIEYNRVLTGSGLPSVGDFETLSTIVTSDVRGSTRHDWASDVTKVRLFYVRGSDGAIVYRDSVDDAVTFGSATVLDSSITWAITAIAAVSPELIFVCRRNFSTVSGIQKHWLDIVAFHYTAGGWQRVDHPKGTTRLRLADSVSISEFWDAPFQFDAAWVDEANALACVVFIDDLAGRPASSTYQRRQWGDIVAVEAIDFSEPERDEVVGLRMNNIGGLLVLHGRRTLADTDFVSTQQGVLYYSPDGIRWSEAYITLDEADWNWGIPVYWRGLVWLIAQSDMWYSNPTLLWGGVGSTALDITPKTISISTEEPTDDFATSSASLTVLNPDQLFNSHPFFVENAQVTIAAGWSGTEEVTLFEGTLEKPEFSTEQSGSTIDLNANDISANLKQGVSDRVLVFPSPLRRAWNFDTVVELEDWSMLPSSAWGWNTSSGNGYAEAIKAGASQLLVGTALNGAIGVDAHIRIVNPAVGLVTGTANCNVTAEVIVAMDSLGTSYYSVRCGKDVTRFELWKVLPSGETKLATSSISYPDVSVNSTFGLRVTQFQQTLIVGLYAPGSSSVNEIMRYFDEHPLSDGAICGVQATLLVDKPGTGTYDTVEVTSFYFHGHDAEWTAEEFLRALAVNRGVRTLTGNAEIDKEWTALGTDWEFVDPPVSNPFVTQGPDYFGWNGLSVDKCKIWHTTYDKQDFIVDMDMQIGYDNTVAVGWFGQAGIACRFNDTKETGVEFTVSASNFGGVVRQSFIQLLVYDYVASVKTLVVNMAIPPLVPIFVGERTTFRFVVTGPWYSVYVNGLHAGTLYDDTIVRAGAFGVMHANGGGIFYSTKIPAFSLGTWPIIKPNESLDSPFTEVLKRYNGWVRASGDSLEIGNDISSVSEGTITDALIMSSQAGGDSEKIFTHCRVISKDPDGIEITGSTYSPSLWRTVGRPRWKIEEVEGLRNEKECRDRAWKFLLDQERFGNEREYPISMKLAWERRDLFTVNVAVDDTALNLYVMGIGREWSRDTEQDFWRGRMTVILQDKQSETLDRATEREP